jgi:ABC-type multidrug transport system permease subunit
MRRLVLALLNTLAVVFVGLGWAAVLTASYLTWSWTGVAWAAVPCAVIAAICCVWLGLLAEGVAGEDERR